MEKEWTPKTQQNHLRLVNLVDLTKPRQLTIFTLHYRRAQTRIWEVGFKLVAARGRPLTKETATSGWISLEGSSLLIGRVLTV